MLSFCSQRSSSGPSSSSAAAAITRDIPGCTPSASLVDVDTAQNQRIQALEEELKRLREVADEAKASAARAAKRERFILEEISKAIAAMLCKLYLSPRVCFEWSLFATSFLTFLDAGVRSSSESIGLNDRIEALVGSSTRAANDFWSNPHRAHVMLSLQDRTAEVGNFVEGCRKTLAAVHRVMSPHNIQPESFSGLMVKLRDVDEVYKQVKIQMIAGAKVALALVHLYHPEIDLLKIATKTSVRPPMEAHLKAARIPAVRVVRQITEDDDELIDNLLEFVKS